MAGTSGHESSGVTSSYAGCGIHSRTVESAQSKVAWSQSLNMNFRSSLGTVGFAWVVQPFLMKETVAENLIGRRSANVGKTRADEHKVIYRSEHRHNGNDESGTRSADEDHAFMARQDVGDVDRTFTRIGTIELPRVHINDHSSDTVIRQVLAHPIPATGTLGAAMHQGDSVGLAWHAPMLPKQVSARWRAPAALKTRR